MGYVNRPIRRIRHDTFPKDFPRRVGDEDGAGLRAALEDVPVREQFGISHARRVPFGREHHRHCRLCGPVRFIQTEGTRAGTLRIQSVVEEHQIAVCIDMEVSAACLTGTKVLQYTDTWNEGVIICGYALQDMQYTELREYLPESFQMLLVASPAKWADGLPDGVVGLPMPIKVYDLVNTVEMMLQTMERQRKKRRGKARERSTGEKQVIEEAKALLMERNNMTEEEAHRYLQKSSMESGTNMSETAQMILTIMNE